MPFSVIGFRLALEAFTNPDETLTLQVVNREDGEADPADLPPGYRDKLLAWAAYPEEP